MSIEAVEGSSSPSERALRCVVCTADLRRTMGGPSRSVPQLCDALARAGIRTSLVGAVDSTEDLILPGRGVEFTDVGAARTRANIVSAVRAALLAGPPENAVIHDNGIWRPFHHYLARAATRARIPIVLSPRGALSPWSLRFKYAKKQLAWLLYQRGDLASLTAFHATSELEASEIRALGFRQPIAVIANGIELPHGQLSPKPARAQRRMLFLSRIHPKKGLLNLLRAWKVVKPGPEWRLVIAGPDEGGHQRAVQALADSLGVRSQVDFPGEISDADKWALYAQADVFVLPSFSENFGIVVAEALASGTPAISTTGTPWRELPERGFGWWPAPTVDALASTIREATSMPQTQLREMGKRAAPWAREQFSWDAIANQMKALHRWLTAGGKAPTFVQQLRERGPSPRYLLR